MYKRIMVPVDLRHTERLGRALTTASDLAGHYGAEIVYVAVTSPEPGELGRKPAEVEAKLSAFAEAEAARAGARTSTHLVVTGDPAADLDKKLLAAVEECGADLVVMASHIPNVSDYIWASHGGTLALHSKASVMLVRG